MSYTKELEISFEEGLNRAKEVNRQKEFLELIEQGTLNVNEVLDIMKLRTCWDWEWFESDYAEADD